MWLQRLLLLLPIAGGAALDLHHRAAAASKLRCEAESRLLGPGVVLRPLTVDDALNVNGRWDYGRDERSLDTVRRRIARGGIALGVEAGGELRASILHAEAGRLRGSGLAMLHVDEAYRRRGYGGCLLREATRMLVDRDEPRAAFIRGGNEASEALFASQGWAPAKKRRSGRRGRAPQEWLLPPPVS